MDISACGLWFERSFFDVRVTHPHAASNVTKSLKELYKRDEMEKREKYEERVIESEKGSFSPMVFLTTGGAGPESTAVLKRLAEMISSKRSVSYSHVINHIRTTVRFALLRSILIAIRGVRGSSYREKPLVKTSLNLIPQSSSYDV